MAALLNRDQEADMSDSREDSEDLNVLHESDPKLFRMVSRHQRITEELITVEGAIEGYLKSRPSAKPLLATAHAVADHHSGADH